jgi:putative endonuclease
MPRNYFVYILANSAGVLYVGVTNSLLHRIHQHRTHTIAGFTARYRVTRLVHFEETTDIAAISREKQIKGWRRSKKVALIEAGNPKWEDLAADWYDVQRAEDPSLHSG